MSVDAQADLRRCAPTYGLQSAGPRTRTQRWPSGPLGNRWRPNSINASPVDHIDITTCSPRVKASFAICTASARLGGGRTLVFPPAGPAPLTTPPRRTPASSKAHVALQSHPHSLGNTSPPHGHARGLARPATQSETLGMQSRAGCASEGGVFHRASAQGGSQSGVRRSLPRKVRPEHLAPQAGALPNMRHSGIGGGGGGDSGASKVGRTGSQNTVMIQTSWAPRISAAISRDRFSGGLWSTSPLRTRRARKGEIRSTEVVLCSRGHVVLPARMLG